MLNGLESRVLTQYITVLSYVLMTVNSIIGLKNLLSDD